MSVDLHSHTTLSDGNLTPPELVQAAARAGVSVLAVTDHDTTVAVPEAIEAGAKAGVRVIPGIEISSHVGDKNLHLLAYFALSRLALLAEWQEERKRAREERLDRMLERLRELGAPISREDVTGPDPDPRRAIGRPHVAAALVARGHVRDIREAFRRYLGQGCPAYVDFPRPDAREACALVRRLGGVAVVAHPGLDGLEPDLVDLKESGVQGVEVFHPDHKPAVTSRLLARARELDLIATGGSDFHGRNGEGGVLGQSRMPREQWERLEEALARAAADA